MVRLVRDPALTVVTERFIGNARRRRPGPTDPPKYLGGDGRFAHGAQVGRNGAANGGAGSVRGRPSAPTFRPEDFGL